MKLVYLCLIKRELVWILNKTSAHVGAHSIFVTASLLVYKLFSFQLPSIKCLAFANFQY